MLILNRGNNSSGYSIVESIIAVFLAGTLLTAILGFSITAVRAAKRNISKIENLITTQNESVKNLYSDSVFVQSELTP